MTSPYGAASPSGLPTPDATNSFWHSEPSPLLTGHRTTRSLPDDADVVIIGSGITGASVAHHLLSDRGSTGSPGDGDHSKKLRVVMLEAREACWGATGRNGGHIFPNLLSHPHDPSIAAFELRNFDALSTLRTTKNIACEFATQTGVTAIYSASTLHEIERALKTLRSARPKIAQLMHLVRDPVELERLRVSGAMAALVTNAAARLWPYKLVARVLGDLLTASTLPGGDLNLQTLTPVTALHRASRSSWQVVTDRGSITAPKVVLATNAYTSHLLPSLSDLIVPVRGQMSALHPPPSLDGQEDRLHSNYCFEGEGIDDYLIQRPDEAGGHFMFGGGRQCLSCIGVSDDSVIDDTTAKYLRRRLIDAFALPEDSDESAHELKATHEWTGIMGFSRDDLPWVGPVPACLLPAATSSSSQPGSESGAEDTGLYLSAGYTGHGMPNAWLCGAAVAKMVRADAPSSGVDAAVAATGLPWAYVVSEERVRRAREGPGVGNRDWAEMEGHPKSTDEIGEEKEQRRTQ